MTQSASVARICGDVTLSAVDSLTAADLDSLAQSARARGGPAELWPSDERFWFSGTAGVSFSADDNRALRRCWTQIVVRLGSRFVAEDKRRRTPGRVMAWLDRLVEPREDIRLEGDAGATLERVLGGEVWLAVIAIWNACCAAGLADRLSDDLTLSLEDAWRRANVGPTPLDRMNGGGNLGGLSAARLSP